MDGYQYHEELIDKFLAMQNLMDEQVELNNQLIDLSQELETIPKMPSDIEQWINSLPDIEKASFKLSDFSRMFDITKEYNNLLDKVDNNSSKLKIAVIDNVIDRINSILDRSKQ